MNDDHKQMHPNTTQLSHESSLSPSLPKPKKGKKSLPPAVKVLLAIGILVLLGAGMTAYVYTNKPTDSTVRKIVDVVPYPAARVGSHSLTISQYLDEYDALMGYFDSLGTDPSSLPTEEEIEVNIIDTMINKAVIGILAEDFGIELDQAQVDEMYQEMIENSGSQEEFQKELSDTFGWSEEEFIHSVIEPIVLAAQIEEFVVGNEEIQGEAKMRANDAFGRLEAGEEFSVVASETNDDRSAIFGGDLGYLSIEEMPEEWISPLESTEVGGFTPVIESSDGYAILQLYDRIANDEGVEELGLAAILIRKKTVEQLISEYIESAKIKRYLGKEV